MKIKSKLFLAGLISIYELTDKQTMIRKIKERYRVPSRLNKDDIIHKTKATKI